MIVSVVGIGEMPVRVPQSGVRMFVAMGFSRRVFVPMCVAVMDIMDMGVGMGQRSMHM